MISKLMNWAKQYRYTKPILKWTLFSLKWLFLIGLLLGLLGGSAALGFIATFVKDEPIRSRIEIETAVHANAITSFAYYNDSETLIGQLRSDEDRQLITYNDIPMTIENALLAIEDNNFYSHNGVDFSGLGRALKQQLLQEDVQTGGSTLTQQLARRAFLSLDKTASRKAKELFLAMRIERVLTKEQILAAYLNKMPFGTGANGYNLYGVKAAARGLFGIEDLVQINNAQAAYLAGLPQRPSAYSAFNKEGEFQDDKYSLAKARQELVLLRMLDTGRISDEEYNEALKFDLKASFAAPEKKAYALYPYLMIETERRAAESLLMAKQPDLTLEDVRSEENAELLEDARLELLTGGYKVYTTIDKQIYDIMRNIASNKKNFSPDHPQGGLEQTAGMMIDHKSGAILGMLEGRSFEVEQLNYATQMTRQPGSTMKTIAAYLPSIELGLIQPASVLDDSPIILRQGDGSYHIPKNANNKYSGLVTAREALNRSLNVPALKVFNEILTIPKSWEFVKKLGITTLQPADNGAKTGVLGGLSIGVTVEELTNAYGSIANKGVFNDAYLIQTITDKEGNVVFTHSPKPKRVFNEQSAYLITDMLRTVISSDQGTGASMRNLFKNYGKIPIVGKTGSTQSYGDVWFEGFTPDITLGVWAGHDKQIYPLNESTGGRTRARTIWAAIMNEVTKAKPELFPTKSFTRPDGLVTATVSSITGLYPSALTSSSGYLVTDLFNKKHLPTETDNGVVMATYIVYDKINYKPNPLTPPDFIKEKLGIVRKVPIDALLQTIKEILPRVPAESRRKLEYYTPSDAELDAPSIVDPRVENGKAPGVITNVKATKLNSTTYQITFAASKEVDIVGYRLYEAIDSGSFAKLGPSLDVADPLQFKVLIKPTKRYSYYVTTVDVNGNESPMHTPIVIGSTEPSRPPAAPANVTATPGLGEYTITWSANDATDFVKSYKLFRSTSSEGPFVEYATVTSATTSKVIPNTSAGFFYIVAINSKGSSEASTTIAVAIK